MNPIEQALEALKDGASVCNSVLLTNDRRIVRDGSVLYAQTEEWCKWVEEEIGPKLMAAITALKSVKGEAVPQFRSPGSSDWYDGLPDQHDGHGPYETRVLYTAPQPEAQPIRVTDTHGVKYIATMEPTGATNGDARFAVVLPQVDLRPTEFVLIDGQPYQTPAPVVAELLRLHMLVKQPEAQPDMRAVCEALGFDPTNHHNAAKCPYCRPQRPDDLNLQCKSTQKRLATLWGFVPAAAQQPAAREGQAAGAGWVTPQRVLDDFTRMSDDAARYRYLRSGPKTRQGLTIIGKGGTRLISRDELRALMSFDFWCTPEELDAAIDGDIAAKSNGVAGD